ncbi:MAG: trehalose-6-phosphate synthase [Planctomycetes bacterium]|nr:trehalose-6-phosphate synthase [Planctomycetota bacterium]
MRRNAQLIVVSNRLPIRIIGTGAKRRFEPGDGGLATALGSLLEERPCNWIGWLGRPGPAPRKIRLNGMQVIPVPISSAEIDAFYHGFSNRTLWPLYHDVIRTPLFEHRWWPPYVDVNERFAAKAIAEARRGDILWIHDYQLQLVPQFARRLRPDLRIGFFLHIPFPPEELFAWLPWRSEVVEGLLGADVIGFQTHANAQNFSRAARKYTDAEGTDTELHYQGRTIQVGSFPISIDFRNFEELARSPKVLLRAKEIRQHAGVGRKLILCVDRLDYTKGIEQRLLAFEQLLERREASVDDCVLMQIAVPSRERVREYTETRTRVERIVGRINGEFSEPGIIAVHYFRRNVSREELVAFYVAADIMLVTPLRDGMNVVAKEFVACRTDHNGVLILSELAGAARELRQAIQINPHDVEDITAALVRALHMHKEESRQRMVVMRTIVRRHDVHHWADEFFQALKK